MHYYSNVIIMSFIGDMGLIAETRLIPFKQIFVLLSLSGTETCCTEEGREIIGNDI